MTPDDPTPDDPTPDDPTPDDVTLDDLAGRLRAFAADRGWEQYHTPKNLVMALSGEVGELVALFQWLTPDEASDAMRDPERRADVLDELADVTIYLVRLADVLGVDLLAAADAKIDRNEDRFPAKTVGPID